MRAVRTVNAASQYIRSSWHVQTQTKPDSRALACTHRRIIISSEQLTAVKARVVHHTTKQQQGGDNDKRH